MPSEPVEERRSPDAWIVRAVDVDHKACDPEEHVDLDQARERVHQLAADPRILKAEICSKRKPRRALLYYYSGTGEFHDLDRRQPVPAERFARANLPS